MNTLLTERQVIILKSNVSTAYDVMRLGTLLDGEPSVSRWTVDAEDIDCVIRIESNGISCDEVIAIVRSLGYECSELE